MKEFDLATKALAEKALANMELPPKDFSKDYNATTGLVGSLALGGLGYAVGGHVGIALLGTAISGAWVFAIPLGLIGLFTGLFNE